MNETPQKPPRQKRQFSLKAFLAAMLAICIGLAMLRVGLADPLASVCAITLIVLVIAAFVAYATGHSPLDGTTFGIVILLIVVYLWALFTPVRY